MSIVYTAQGPPIRMLIVDDHKMVRDGLRVMLSSLKKSLHIDIDEAESGEEAILKTERKAFDMLIIDYQLPHKSGAETIAAIRRFRPGIKVLALSNYDELPYIQSMLDAGANGYVLKNIEPPQMLNAIHTILSGQAYYSNEVAIKLINLNESKVKERLLDKNKLTKREKEVLKLIGMEYTNEEIAGKLSLSKRTIDAHRQNIIIKLHAKNTVGLVKAAFRLNLI
jgi:DNA-binding NarL/FixJ family response regulator